MRLLANLKIRTKLLLLLLIPSVGLLGFASNHAWDRFVTLQTMQNVQQLADLNARVSAVIHEVQRERGRTSLFIGSKGTRYATELADQRAASDAAIGELNSFIATARFDSSQMRKALDDIQADLNTLRSHRTQVDQLSLPAADATGRYTTLIGKLLDLGWQAAGASGQAEVTRLANANLALSTAKESVGQLRATGSGQIAQGHFDAAPFQTFVALRSANATSLATFRRFARPDQVAFYETTVTGAPIDGTAQMETAVLERGPAADLSGLDATTWFDQMTARIDLLRTVEAQLADDVRDEAARLAQDARTALFVAIGVASMALIGTVTGSVLVIVSIVGPLGRLGRAADGIAGGDFDQEIQDGGRKDELGTLADAFQRMIASLRATASVASAVAQGDLTRDIQPQSDRDALGHAIAGMLANLRDLVGEVQHVADEVARAAEQLGAGSHEAGVAIQQVATAIQGMAIGAQDTSTSAQSTRSAMSQLAQAISGIANGASAQARQVHNAGATAVELSNEVEEVASNASHVASRSQQAKRSAERGGAAVRETTVAMSEIDSVVSDAASKVKELGALGDRIGTVVETIDDIAEQTSLLALNAAIEAARAGEHGRGFAVVAAEVRKLAERSSRETRQIAELISEVQSGTRNAVEAMHLGATKVRHGSDKAEQAGAALDDIERAVDVTVRQVADIAARSQTMASASRRVTDAMESISSVVAQNTAATEEMTVQSEQVIDAMGSIASVAEEQSAATEEVSASSEEMSAQIEQMSAQAQELAATAQELRRLTARFSMRTPSTNAAATDGRLLALAA